MSSAFWVLFFAAGPSRRRLCLVALISNFDGGNHRSLYDVLAWGYLSLIDFFPMDVDTTTVIASTPSPVVTLTTLC